jgi:hypothetical protein
MLVRSHENLLNTDLKLDLCFSNILLTSTATSDFLGFCYLRPDCLFTEILEREPLDGIYAEYRIRLDNSKASRY